MVVVLYVSWNQRFFNLSSTQSYVDSRYFGLYKKKQNCTIRQKKTVLKKKKINNKIISYPNEQNENLVILNNVTGFN